MTTDIHALALKELTSEIQRLEKELAEARAVQSYHAARAVNVDAVYDKPKPATEVVTGTSVANPVATGGTGATLSQLATLTQYEAAAAVLRNAGTPLKTGQIAEAMISGGFPQKDRKKLTISLFTSLMRKPEVFTKAGSGLWKLAQ